LRETTERKGISDIALIVPLNGHSTELLAFFRQKKTELENDRLWFASTFGYLMMMMMTEIPPGLTLKNSTWCPHCVYVFCTDLRTNSNFCLIKH
jgi:hypothetical protein